MPAVQESASEHSKFQTSQCPPHMLPFFKPQIVHSVHMRSPYCLLYHTNHSYHSYFDVFVTVFTRFSSTDNKVAALLSTHQVRAISKKKKKRTDIGGCTHLSGNFRSHWACWLPETCLMIVESRTSRQRFQLLVMV